MKYVNYERLTGITQRIKPFRGTDNRYPIGSRAQSYKCFYVEKEGNDTIYKLCYGHTHIEHQRTKEDYDKAIASGSTNVHQIQWREDDDPLKYVTYERVPRVLAIVRPDNSFEFVANYYGQGDNMIMSNWCDGFLSRSSRHGGMIYSQWRNDNVFHPIFKGLRVNCDTMQAMTPYQISGYRVMRKVAKEFLKQYVDFYKVAEAMMKCMRAEDFLDMGVELAKELGVKDNSWGGLEIHSSKLHLEAQARLHTAPMDSAVLYCMAHDLNATNRRIAYHMGKYPWATSGEYDLVALFDTMKRKLNKEIYRNNDSVMKEVEYEMGKRYPASEWGVTITVDGKEVEQY